MRVGFISIKKTKTFISKDIKIAKLYIKILSKLVLHFKYLQVAKLL